MQKTLTHAAHKILISAIVQARKDAGMTQHDLASALGEYQSLVARIESGQRRIDVIEFIRLSNILKFDHIKLQEQIRKHI